MGIVVVGSIAIDTISTPKVKKQKVWGGSAIYAAVSLSAFVPVRLLGVIGEDYPQEALRMLESRGIDIAGVERKPGRTFAWEGEYGDDLHEATTLATDLNTFADYSPQVPSAYLKEEYLFLGNIDPDLQRNVLGQMHTPKVVATDTMNHWLNLKSEALIRLLPDIDIFFINEQEAKTLSGETKVVRAAHGLAKLGPRLVVIKSGEHGAMAYDGKLKRYYWSPAFPTVEVIDPTGAGDSFAGGFLGSLASQNDPFSNEAVGRALAFGNVMASFAISTLGVEGLAQIEKEKIFNRVNALAYMVTDGVRPALAAAVCA